MQKQIIQSTKVVKYKACFALQWWGCSQKTKLVWKKQLIVTVCIPRPPWLAHVFYYDGWMDGWIDGWMDGWMDRWMDGWMVDKYMDVWRDGRISGGWMDGQQKACMDR